jgi:hypothetical protein
MAAPPTPAPPSSSPSSNVAMAIVAGVIINIVATFRELIKARPGHLILAADYAAIELRIAAALAERAVSDLRQRIKQECIDSWFMEQVITGV